MLAQALNTLRRGPDGWSWLPFYKLANRAMKAKCATALDVYLDGEAPASEEEEVIRAAVLKVANQRAQALQHLGQLLSESRLLSVYAMPQHAHTYVQALLTAFERQEDLEQKLSDGCDVAKYWQIALELPLMEMPKNVIIKADINRESILQSILRRAYADPNRDAGAIEKLQYKYLRFAHFELE